MPIEPLLKKVGYQRLIELMTPEEVIKARFLLQEFLNNLKFVDTEKIAIMSYLLGIQEGIHIMTTSESSDRLYDAMLKSYTMGKQHGIQEALLLFGKMPQIVYDNPKQNKETFDKGESNNKL